jgi:hypothetical protein
MFRNIPLAEYLVTLHDTRLTKRFMSLGEEEITSTVYV